VALQATRLPRGLVRFSGRADTWAAGAKAMLQRRTRAGWKAVVTRRFSPSGTVRWRLAVPGGSTARYRILVRLDGEFLTSPAVRVPRKR
jgi:hypothetical protein